MQMEDKTLERYWKMAREETFEPDGKEGTLFVIINGVLYRKVDRIFEDSVKPQLVVGSTGEIKKYSDNCGI